MQRCGLTGAAAGDLIGVDGRTIRRRALAALPAEAALAD